MQRLTGPGSVIRQFISSFGSIGIGKVLQIALLVLMAQRMDVAAFGALAVAISVSQVAAYVFAAGLPNGAVRFIAAFQGQQDWRRLRGFMEFAGRLLAVGCLAAIVVGAPLAFSGWLAADVVWFVVALTIISAVGVARAGLSLGLGDVLGSLGPREVFAPAISILGMLLLGVVANQEIALIYLAGYLLAEVIGALLLRRVVPPQVYQAEPWRERSRWLRVLVPMQFVALLTITLQRLDLILVGVLFDLRTAALYAAAQRVAQILSVLARVLSHTLAPQVARAYHALDRPEVWRVVRVNVVLGALIGIPIFLGFAVASPWIMAQFGPEFVDGAVILVTLSVGQLAGAVLGPMTQVLTMTAHERLQVVVLGAICLVAIPGYLLVAPAFGAVGIAAFSSVIWTGYNVLSLVFALRHVPVAPATAGSGHESPG